MAANTPDVAALPDCFSPEMARLDGHSDFA
jgi:hypothetical protein